MVGIIIIGHGKVASGLLSAVNLIAGRTKEIYALNFLQDTDKDIYSQQLEILIDDLLTRCDSVLIFCDLPGGTPFHTASTFTKDEIRLVTSVSVTMLLECILARDYLNTINELIDLAISTGKEHIAVLPQESVLELEHSLLFSKAEEIMKKGSMR